MNFVVNMKYNLHDNGVFLLFLKATTQSSVPPAIFTYCPSNITVVTNQQSATVWWRDPVIYVDGSTSQTASLSPSSVSPGGQFEAGITKIVYTANNAVGLPTYCSFFITVQTYGN